MNVITLWRCDFAVPLFACSQVYPVRENRSRILEHLHLMEEDEKTIILTVARLPRIGEEEETISSYKQRQFLALLPANRRRERNLIGKGYY
jgi:hypothetical protein